MKTAIVVRKKMFENNIYSKKAEYLAFDADTAMQRHNAYWLSRVVYFVSHGSKFCGMQYPNPTAIYMAEEIEIEDDVEIKKAHPEWELEDYREWCNKNNPTDWDLQFSVETWVYDMCEQFGITIAELDEYGNMKPAMSEKQRLFRTNRDIARADVLNTKFIYNSIPAKKKYSTEEIDFYTKAFDIDFDTAPVMWNMHNQELNDSNGWVSYPQVTFGEAGDEKYNDSEYNGNNCTGEWQRKHQNAPKSLRAQAKSHILLEDDLYNYKAGIIDWYLSMPKTKQAEFLAEGYKFKKGRIVEIDREKKKVRELKMLRDLMLTQEWVVNCIDDYCSDDDDEGSDPKQYILKQIETETKWYL